MGYRPIEEYEPKQRGQVACARQLRGNKYLRDGDHTPEECPNCGFLLRVRREHKGPPILWCPCGYEIPAASVGV